MTTFIKFFQNPFIKIILAPFALIGVGTIVGLKATSTPIWLNVILLFFIVFSSQLIDHYFYQRNVQKNRKSTSQIVLYVCEAILFISLIVFTLSNNWIINLLLVLYIGFIHLQYMPFQIVNTLYQFILMVFFNGFILNSVAFYSQTTSITSNFLILLIPMVLFTAGLTIEINALQYQVITRKKQSNVLHWISMILCFVGISTGIYLSLPSATYYIVQILFGVVVTFSLIPAIVKVDNEKQRQNKINYLSTLLLIFSIFYSLAIIF